MGLFVLFLILVIALVARRKPTRQNSSEIQTSVIRQPVDQAGTLQMGELLTEVQRTEDMLLAQHPDWVDEDGNPYHAEIPIDDEVPLHFRDANGINESWIVVQRGEEMHIVSASALVNKLPARFDPLPANPKKVGRFYVGWGFGKTGGLSSLVETTRGKILVVGSAILIGYLLGMFTIVLHVGHL